MLDKEALIRQRAQKLGKYERQDLRHTWEQNKGGRLHLVSVQRLLSEHFDWDLARLALWAKEMGLDGLELRAETIAKWQNQQLPREMVIGLHLSDKACWTSLWSKDQERIPRAFGSLAVAREYLGYTDPESMVQSLRTEIEIGRRLGARYFVFHASEIDYGAVLRGQLQDDKEVIAAAAAIIKRLACPELLIENAPAHEAGAHDSQELRKLGQTLQHLGFALDTSHLQVYLFSRHKVDEMTKEINQIKADGRIIIKVLHLSESSLRIPGSGHDLQPEDFWERRKLANQLVVDDHLPVGQSIQNPWELIEAAGAPIVTHELKAETFELLEKALLVQQAYLTGLKI